jgi:hypothetical protein
MCRPNRWLMQYMQASDRCLLLWLQLELQRVRTQLGLAQAEKELLQAELAKASGKANSRQLKWSAASREAGHLAALQPRVEELQQQVYSLTAELDLSKKQVGCCCCYSCCCCCCCHDS